MTGDVFTHYNDNNWRHEMFPKAGTQFGMDSGFYTEFDPNAFRKQREASIVGKWFVARGMHGYDAFSFDSLTAFEIYADNMGWYGKQEELQLLLKDTEHDAWVSFLDRFKKDTNDFVISQMQTLEFILNKIQNT